MLGAIDWANLSHASAFVLGALGATIATLRVMRAVLDANRRNPLRRRDDEK